MQVDPTLVTDLLIDLFFMSDILLNFNTGFISDQVSPLHVCHLPSNAQPTITKALPCQTQWAVRCQCTARHLLNSVQQLFHTISHSIM